jgi:hypothetical protein
MPLARSLTMVVSVLTALMVDAMEKSAMAASHRSMPTP